MPKVFCCDCKYSIPFLSGYFSQYGFSAYDYIAFNCSKIYGFVFAEGEPVDCPHFVPD